MKKSLALLLALISFTLQAQLMVNNLSIRKPVVPNTYTFTYKGVIQKFIVPNRVTSIQVNAIGAKGGTGARGQLGGSGANITTNLNVTPGQTLYIVVGGFPGQSATRTTCQCSAPISVAATVRRVVRAGGRIWSKPGRIR